MRGPPHRLRVTSGEADLVVLRFTDDLDHHATLTIRPNLADGTHVVDKPFGGGQDDPLPRKRGFVDCRPWGPTRRHSEVGVARHSPPPPNSHLMAVSTGLLSVFTRFLELFRMT